MSMRYQQALTGVGPKCPNKKCGKDMGWNSHGMCQHCKKYCGCSFSPTSSNDFCDDHRPR